MDLLTAMRLFSRDAGYSSLFLGDDISPKQRQGALAFAPHGAEQPLALIDESAMRGGKEGMLFTDAAFYQSKPALRVPLSAFRGLPSADATSIQTAQGPARLMELRLDGAKAAVRGLFNALSMLNNGDTDVVMPPLPLVGGPVEKIAHQHLIHPKIFYPGDLDAGLLSSVVGRVRGPLDALGGERVVALINEAGNDWEDAVVLTTTHLCVRILSKQFIVPYGAIEQVSFSPGTIYADVKLVTSRGRLEVSLTKANEAGRQLAAFLQALLSLPPPHRVGGAFELATDLDPSGAVSAMTRCAPAEARVAILLQLIAGATRKSLMPQPAALDLAHRVALLHATIATGRTAHQGVLLSPLAEPDLGYALQVLLGQPSGQHPHPPFTTLDFAIQSSSGNVKALASSAVGLLAAATIGIGWVSVPEAQVQGLRFTVGAMGHFTGFTAQAIRRGQPEPLPEANPELSRRLSTSLASIEAHLLLRRTLFGWGTPPWELLALPPQQLQAAAAPMADFAISLAPFGQG